MYDEITEVAGISMITFNNTEEHYKDANALYEITFGAGPLEASSMKALDKIKEILKFKICPYFLIVGIILYDCNKENSS